MADTQILVASKGDVAQVRVIGRATFVCSQSFRRFGTQTACRGVGLFLVDLSECTGMDSTFMGVLAMLAQPSRGGAAMTLVNVDEHNRKLLRDLGIERLFCFSRTTGKAVDWRALCSATPEEQDALAQAKNMLEATEELMRLDENNIPKFTDVVDFLRDDIQRLER